MRTRQVVRTSLGLYCDLQDAGYDLGLEHCGGLNLATTPDRMVALKRRISRFRPTGMECRLLGPAELKERHPYLNTEDVLGGVWVPEDAHADAGKVSAVLAHLAGEGGTRFVSRCEVTNVLTTRPTSLAAFQKLSKGIRVTGVETTLGRIECEYFVNSAGFWSRAVGEMSQPPVAVPIHPCEHYHLHTKARHSH